MGICERAKDFGKSKLCRSQELSQEDFTNILKRLSNLLNNIQKSPIIWETIILSWKIFETKRKMKSNRKGTIEKILRERKWAKFREMGTELDIMRNDVINVFDIITRSTKGQES